MTTLVNPTAVEDLVDVATGEVLREIIDGDIDRQTYARCSD